MVNNWEKLGTGVTLFAPRIWPFSIPPVCDVVYVPTVRVRFVREYLYLMILPIFILLRGLKQRPSAVYCREMGLMAPTIYAARLLGAPVIVEVNGFLPGDLAMIGSSRMKLSIFRLFQRINFKLADRLIFAGKNYLALFRERYDIEEKKIRFVPNGVDTGLFSPGDRKLASRGTEP